MKNLTVVLILALSVGCRGVNRLMDGGSGSTPPAPKVISSLAPLGNAPEFNVETPTGTARVVYFDALPLNGTINTSVSAGATVKVFMEDRGILQWFLLKDTYSDAFYYSYDATTGVIQIHGQHLEAKAYCVYQYVTKN